MERLWNRKIISASGSLRQAESSRGLGQIRFVHWASIAAGHLAMTVTTGNPVDPL